MSDVVLKINGGIYRGWTTIKIRRSLEQVADTFNLGVTDNRSGALADQKKIKSGDLCEIWIDDDKVITGFVDNVGMSYDNASRSITVSGRSKAGDLVDCSFLGKQFKNRTLLQIAEELCAPFGLSVISETDTGASFKKQAIEEGQPFFEFIESLARVRAVRLVSNPDGDLVFVRTGNDRVSTPLRLGDNILSASASFSSREQFSEYLIKGQRPGSEQDWGASAADVQVKISGDRVARYRPKVMMIDGPADLSDCRNRGEWQRNTAFGRSRSVVYTVRGWRHSKGLWAPNNIVSVSDPWLEIEADRLVVTVDYSLDDKGERTELQVMPKEALDLIALPDSTESDAKAWVP